MRKMLIGCTLAPLRFCPSSLPRERRRRSGAYALMCIRISGYIPELTRETDLRRGISPTTQRAATRTSILSPKRRAPEHEWIARAGASARLNCFLTLVVTLISGSSESNGSCPTRDQSNNTHHSKHIRYTRWVPRCFMSSNEAFGSEGAD